MIAIQINHFKIHEQQMCHFIILAFYLILLKTTQDLDTISFVEEAGA